MTDCRSPQRNSEAHCAGLQAALEPSKEPLTAATMSCFFVYIPAHTWDQKCKHASMISVKPKRKRRPLKSFFLRIHTFTDLSEIPFKSVFYFLHTHTAGAHHKNLSQNAHRPSATMYLHERNTEKCHATIPQLSSKWDLTAGWEQQAW